MDQTPRLFANTLSVFESIEKLIRRLLSRAETAGEEPPPTGAAETDATPVGESTQPEIAQTFLTPDASSPPSEIAWISVDDNTERREPRELEPVAAPEQPARFEWRVLWTPKGGNDDKEWEDGYALSAGGGVVAVADGAGDGIFSKLWADLLLNSFVANPIPLDEPAAVEPWIREQRRAWLSGIRYSEQRWSIQLKIDRSCGAATFVALQLDPLCSQSLGPDAATGWTAWAVGDACLFHIRRGSLLTSFPMVASTDFDLHPFLYQSKALRETPLAVVLRGELQAGDLIVLATDAISQRLLAEIEAGTPPEWDRYWNLDQAAWRQEIDALRQQNAIVNDDCTLLVCRLPEVAPISTEELAAEPRDEAYPEAQIDDGDAIGSASTADVEATRARLAPAFDSVAPIDESSGSAQTGDDPPASEQDQILENGRD
jgi:hypothetical protein